MGRGRLRRGYSLEVIFEEDPDFCSHLDSLESVGIRFGVKETEDTISVDSLLEDYRIRFQSASDKDHVFQSLDGIWDIREMDRCFVEWDEFSTDSMSKVHSLGAQSLEVEAPRALSPSEGSHPDSNLQIAGSGGRRSRVSRRQIVEANWVTTTESDEQSSTSSSSSGNGSTKDNDDSSMGSEGSSEVKVVDEPKIQPVLLLNKFRVNEDSGLRSTSNVSPPHPIFGQCRIVTGSDKDTLDSYISTRTDDTETDAYTFADPFNDSASVASTTYESTSASSSSAGSVCTVNDRSSFGKGSPVRSNSSSPSDHDGTPGFPCNLRGPSGSLFRGTSTTPTVSPESPILKEVAEGGSKMSKHCPSHPNVGTSSSSTSSSSGGSSCSMDVKRVRALFELPTTWNRRRFNMAEDTAKDIPPTAGKGKESKKGTGGSNSSQHIAVGKVLRSAYTQFNLGQSSGAQGGQLMDFAELLVNDKVVIEETPDSFQPLRLKRDQLKCVNTGEHQSLSKGGFSTLRRSKSMGTGMSTVGSSPWCLDGLPKSRPKIIAEEMPAPDTVKNVRTVFERILQLRSSHKQENSVQGGSGESGGGGSEEGPTSAFSIIKKSLSSVKSNPSSKIYRSESLRDDFPSSSFTSLMSSTHQHHHGSNRRWGKPILLGDDYGGSASSVTSSPVPFKINDPNDNSKLRNSLMRKHAKVERKFSEPIILNKGEGGGGYSRDIFNESSAPSLQEEGDFSSLSSENAAKLVSPDVLQRIRSYGTTTTYFGGQIVAQTVKNRKLPVTGRHQFHQSDPAANCYFNWNSPTQDETTPSQFARMRNEEGFDPSGTPGGGSSRLSRSDLSRASCSRVASQLFEDSSGTGRRAIDFDGLIDSFRFGGGQSSRAMGNQMDAGIDTTPRIISVLPKSPSGSPVGSPMEGRSTPDGCEGQESIKCQWTAEESEGVSGAGTADKNNNEIVSKIEVNQEGGGQQFSQTVEGAWF